MNQQTAIQYLLDRLKEYGVDAVFGVPGDFVYPVCDAISDDAEIQWVACTNELNASYAAEGYSRTKGVGVVVSTYGPGELSIFSGLAGAHAESCKVVAITGMPGLDEQSKPYRKHHMIADPKLNYQLFMEMVKPFTAGGDSAVMITAENCVEEVDRLIAAMMYHSKPIYFAFPRDQWNKPIKYPEVKSKYSVKSNADTLNIVVEKIANRIAISKQACFVPGYLLRRYKCVKAAKTLIEKSGLPFFSTYQDKGVLSEEHTQFKGMYLGGWTELSDKKIVDFMESCDCIIGLGNENHEFNSAFNTVNHDKNATINIMPHETYIGKEVFANVEMADVIEELKKRVAYTDIEAPSFVAPLKALSGMSDDNIDYNSFAERLQFFMQPNDIFVADTSLTTFCVVPILKLPDNVNLEASVSWGAIGWGTPAILGNAIAAKNRRCILVSGEGGHQLSVNEVGTFYRYGCKPIFIIVNNGGYLAERATNRYPDEEYNDVSQWNYTAIPKVMGCVDWYTQKVRTLGELDAALEKIKDIDVGVYLEVIVDADIMPKGGDFFFTNTAKLHGQPTDRTWAKWLEKGREIN